MVKIKLRLVTIEITLPRRLYDQFMERVVPKFGSFEVAVMEAMERMLKEMG